MNAWQMFPVYSARTEKDEHFAKTREDSCTPVAMRHLLRRIATDPTYELMNTIMRGCRTGKRKIASGLSNSIRPVKHFAHKTGSLGSIANDVGVIDFGSGLVGLISVMTCGSAASASNRDSVIADSAEAVVSYWSTDLG